MNIFSLGTTDLQIYTKDKSDNFLMENHITYIKCPYVLYMPPYIVSELLMVDRRL